MIPREEEGQEVRQEGTEVLTHRATPPARARASAGACATWHSLAEYAQWVREHAMAPGHAPK